jgi:hypothetical protein
MVPLAAARSPSAATGDFGDATVIRKFRNVRDDLCTLFMRACGRMLVGGCLFKEIADQIVRSGTRPGSTVLEHGLHLPNRPAFAGGYHAHPSALA